ncbi:MAG: FHA domain-containing protein [Betaproteobacteria bacterium]
MISVEVLSRHRDVVARHRCDASGTTIGRAYDNDVVIDDPTVAPHHLRIYRDGDGTLVAEDLGSTNGLYEGDGDRRSARLVLDGEHPIRIGRTYLRVREASYPVAPERRLATSTRVLPAVLSLIAVVLGLEIVNLWLAETAEPKTAYYLLPLLIVALLVLVWTTAWAILSRIFTGHARFERHLRIALIGVLAFALFDELIDYAAFSLSWRWLADYGYVANWLLFATLCFFQLREISPARLKAKAATLAAFTAVAIATQSIALAETRSRFGQQAYVRHLKPPLLRLAAPQSEEAFFADAARIKTGLDSARKEAPPSGGFFQSFDE